MADVDEGRPGRQLASNLRELMKQVDIRTGTDRDKERERDADWASESQASVRDIFARRRAAIPAPSVSSTSSRPAPRRLSIGSEVSSAPTAMYTPGRRIDELSDDGSTVDTPIARAPAQPLPSSAASLHALRARLENPSEQDTASDLTGWDRSARSLMTTRGQASSSRLHVYDEGSNLLDEDLGAVPSLAISHVDSTLQFQPSVGNTSRTPIAPRQRPHVIPKGPSLQSASLAERLAGIPDDGLEFDDTDREDFDRNRMDDDSDDLLHQENDLLRSSSPPPPDSPMKPSPVLRHARHLSTGQPLSGSWENVMAEGSVMSLPNVDERPGRKSGPANGSSSGSGSRLMQAINDGEQSYQRSLQENSQGSSQDDLSRTSPDKSGDPAPRSGNTTAKSRLSTIGRSRLPLAKPATPQSQPKAGVSEISFPRPASPSGLPPKRDSPGRPTSRLGEPASRLPRPTSPSPSIAASESGAPDSPERPRRHSQVPVTPSRIPRVSMSASHTGSPGESPSRPAGPRSSTSLGMAPTSTPPRAVSSLGMNGPSTTPSRRLTPARSTSSLGHHQTPPETDVDRERNWGKALPKLTHANLRMRHESMESSVHSYLGGLSPSRGGSVAGRPTTPSFVGYARKEGSEVSSSQGSAGSDEDANLRRSRKMSVASAQGTKSGRELRGSSSLTSPTASSLARSSGPGLARHSSLKTPSKPAAGMMRHSASFTGSPSASSFRGSDRGASPINSPRKVTARHSTEFVGVKDYERVRERDWGRPTGSRAIGVANVRPRVVSGGSPGGVGKSPGLGRNRVVSGGSAGGSERPESPLARTRASGVRPRPHTIHFGAHSTPNLEELGQREPLDGGEEFLERDDEDMSSQNESVLEWRRQQQVEDLEEETEVEEERPSSPSPPSPSRSIPLPPSPPPVVVPRVQLHPPREPDPPTEASVSLFRDGPTNGEITPAAESTTRVSLGQERDNVPSIPDEAPPSETYSPKRRSFAQPESPTISFMDTLPALPDPPSDEEISVVVPPVRPSVNTRLNVLAREPSPGSASASEKTPRASTISLRAPSPGISRTPTPPEPATQAPPNVASGLKLSGVEPVAQSRALVDPEKLEVPRMSRSRSRSNTLGTSLPRVEVNTAVTRDDLDSAATPVATRWMEQAAMRRERALLGGEKTVLASENTRATEIVKSETRSSSSSAGPVLLKPSPPVSKAPSPLGAHTPALPASSAPPLQARHSDPQLPPMMSQKGKEILERIQRQAATLARDLETESSLPVPQGDEVQAETDQIVKLSTTARAERERLEKLRVARNAAKEEKVAVQVVPARRRSLSWILFSVLMTALCAWLALYALSHHATNVYLDPLYPVLYGGDVNPLRHARTIDTFPSSWNSYLVPKPGIQHWVSMHLTPLSQKLWAIPGQAVQHLMSSWPPS